MPTTTRGAFPYPAGADNWKMFRTAIQGLADRAAAATVLWRQTAAAARGNAGTAGTLHQASDTGAVSLDTGTSWLGLLTEAGGLITTAASKVGLTVRGAASQTSDLQQWQNSAGAVLGVVNAQGSASFADLSAAGILGVGGGNDATTQALIISTASNRKALIARGAANQTGNLAEFQNSAGAVLALVRANGEIACQLADGVGLRTILVGAADSAGTGYRTLRVEN